MKKLTNNRMHHIITESVHKVLKEDLNGGLDEETVLDLMDKIVKKKGYVPFDYMEDYFADLGCYNVKGLYGCWQQVMEENGF